MFRLTLVLLALISTVSFAAVIELPLPRFELLKAAPQTGDDIPGYNLYGVGSRQSGDQLVGYIANEKTYPAPGGNASTNIQFPYNAPSATITAIQVWFISTPDKDPDTLQLTSGGLQQTSVTIQLAANLVTDVKWIVRIYGIPTSS